MTGTTKLKRVDSEWQIFRQLEPRRLQLKLQIFIWQIFSLRQGKRDRVITVISLCITNSDHLLQVPFVQLLVR